MPELIEKMFSTEPAPLAPRVSVPPEFEAIVRRCLRREPSQRYASVAELTAALRPFAGHSERAPAPRRLAPPPTSQPAPLAEPKRELADTRLASVPPRVSSSSFRRRPKLLLLVAASALLLGALLRLAWR
jgi:serine/threonine-protein kinase